MYIITHVIVLNVPGGNTHSEIFVNIRDYCYIYTNLGKFIANLSFHYEGVSVESCRKFLS